MLWAHGRLQADVSKQMSVTVVIVDSCSEQILVIVMIELLADF